MKLKDHILVGIPSGLIGPIVGIFCFYWYKFSHTALVDFFNMAAEKNLLSPLLSLCVIINLGIFYLFIRVDYLHAARGVIFSTFVYGLIIMVLKFVS